MGAVFPAIKGTPTLIFDSDTGGTQTPLTANFKASTIIDCKRERSLVLELYYSANASSTANAAQLFVMVSNAATQPAIGDDSWRIVSYSDVLTTDAVLTGTLPTGVDVTVGPKFDIHTVRPIAWNTEPMTSGTQKIRDGIELNVERIRWLVVLAKELGDTSNVGVLKIYSVFAT